MRLQRISTLICLQILNSIVMSWKSFDSGSPELINIGLAIAKQGGWSSMWVVSDDDNHAQRKWTTFDDHVHTATFDCSYNMTVLYEMIGSRVKTLKGDFVNLLVYCPGGDYSYHLTQFYKGSTDKRLFFNWLLLGVDDSSGLPFHLIPEGDNVAAIKSADFEVKYDIWRCLINCYDPGSLRLYMEGVRRPTDVLSANTPPVLPAEFQGFGGRTIDVTYEGSSTSIYVRETKLSNGSMIRTGVEMEVLNTYAALMNFSYRIDGPPGGGFGVYNTDHRQWTGMIGALERGEAELALGGISVTYQRKEVVDYIYPYKYVENSIFFRTDPDAVSSQYFIDIFKPNVWLSLLLSPFVTGLGIWLCLKLLDGKEIADINGVILDSFAILVRQSLGKMAHCRYISSNLILYCYLFAMLVATAVYVGNLIAALAIPKIKMPFSSIEELAANDDFALLVDGGSGTQFLRESKDPKMKLLWQKVRKDPERSYINRRRTTFLKLPPGSKMATFDSKSGIDRYQRIYGVCSVGRLEGTYFPRGVSIAVRKGTPYLKYLDKLMLRMLEAGLFEKWYSMYLPKKICDKTKAKGPRPLSLRDINIVFVLLISGVSLAFVVLLCENIIYKLKGNLNIGWCR